MLCVAKNNSEYVEVTPVAVVKDNNLLNVIKGMNSYNVDTPEYHFELTADMFDENSTQICQYKYYFNKNITKVEIPQGVTSIGAWAFYSCIRLTSVTIGSRMNGIGDYAFSWCTKLAIVDFRSVTQVPKVQSLSFDVVPTTCKFIIPDELYDQWITATNWSAMYSKGYQFVKASEYTEA